MSIPRADARRPKEPTAWRAIPRGQRVRSPLSSPARELSFVRAKFHGLLILVDQHLWSLAPGPSRRPCSTAYALGPSVFTIRAKTMSTDRASVSQGVAGRGAPPLPAMSLGTCRCCCLGREYLLPSPVQVWRHALSSPRGPRPTQARCRLPRKEPPPRSSRHQTSDSWLSTVNGEL